MKYENFKNSVETLSAPPEELTHFEKGLWQAAKGNWEAAHNISQEFEGEPNYDHLHAYLHRVEGDAWNAGYWYRRAGQPVCIKSLDEELADLLIRYL